MHEGSPEGLVDELAELALAMLADESVADELVLAMLADELTLAMTSWSRIPRIFQERIMGAGTVLGLYNVSLQYQQYNANRANCISSSTEHKEHSKHGIWKTFSFESASQNFLGITDVLYLENYEELRNLVFTSIKTVILTHKHIFGKQNS